MKRIARWVLLGVLVLVILPVGSVLVYERVTGTSVIVRFGGMLWLPVDENTPFLSKGVSAALTRPIPEARPGPLIWREVQDGFEAAELPVIAGGAEVDRILLARIDPERFRFVVRNDPGGSKTLDRWLKALNAVLVVNGSYYASTGLPSTPTIIDGAPLGPHTYKARHGAFIAGQGSVRIADLDGMDWKELFSGAQTAVVSYPLLLARDGSHRVPGSSKWLANRSFLAEDADGKIIIGTTEDGFFSLRRLAEFLKAAPLDLTIALNLDGGPVACQAIALGEFRRRSCGRWEVQVEDGRAKMLPPLWMFFDPPMPVVLAVYPKE